jgi:glycosyltransferase involved in cell wall biosynthesis
MNEQRPIRSGESAQHPRLLLFGVTKLSEMLDKGNVWYVRNYEAYFHSVDVAYLIGSSRSVSQGGTTLHSLGSGRAALDLLLAPLRLWRLARELKPDVVVTADQVFSWWTGFLVRLLLGKKIVLMPVSVPEGLYADHGDTLSGLPVWLERRLVRLSFANASRVLTGHAAGGYVDLLRAYAPAKDKLLVVKSFGEALPSPSFLEQRQAYRWQARSSGTETLRLIYVGRLHAEKLVEDLVKCMVRVKAVRPNLAVKLRLIGDGAEMRRLQAMSRELGVAADIEFAGALPNDAIAAELSTADVFMSPLTGNSLREAALIGLPIIAYERDWVVGMLKHEVTALLVASRDVDGLARSVIRLADDMELRRTLSRNVLALADDLWTPQGLQSSLAALHAAVSAPA